MPRFLPLSLGCTRQRTLVLIAVMTGGALGALARHLMNITFQWLLKGSSLPDYPWSTLNVLSTLSVNVLGSFALSFLFFSNYFGAPNTVKLAIGTGFIGAFTTFSTFELETLQLVQKGEYGLALLYVAGSVLLGFAAVLLGRFLALHLTS
jgi:fluoride exporter